MGHVVVVATFKKSSNTWGHAMTNCGQRTRVVAFDAYQGSSGSPESDVISLGDIECFLHDYICQHWEVLDHAQFKDTESRSLVMLEKGHRRYLAAFRAT